MPITLVSHYQFNLSAPYSSGQTIDANEAQVLNVARSERLRKKIFKQVEKLHHQQKVEVLSFEQTLKLEEWVTSLDASYKFPPYTLPPDPIGRIELEKQLIVATTLSESPLSLQDNPSFEEMMTNNPSLEEEARRRLLKKDLAADPSLLGL